MQIIFQLSILLFIFSTGFGLTALGYTIYDVIQGQKKLNRIKSDKL